MGTVAASPQPPPMADFTPPPPESINMDYSSGTVVSELEVDYDTNITKLYECITNCDWDSAIAAVMERSVEAQTWVVRKYEDTQDIMWRFLPIHSACARQPPAALISALLKAFPEGAKACDDQGMYALHYACGNQASREVVRLLLAANPDAAKESDPRGMLPIHYLSCWGPSSVSIVDMVMVANRDVGFVMDDDGNTPLALAKEGEYPERDAVVLALRRWLEKSASPSSSSPSTFVASPPPPPPAKTSRQIKFQDDKKESDANPAEDEDEVQPLSPSQSYENAHHKENAKVEHAAAAGSESVTYLRKEASQIRAENKLYMVELGSAKEDLASVKRELAAVKEELFITKTSLTNAETQVDELETLLDVKGDALDKAQESEEKAIKQLEEVEDERDGLRFTLADVSEAHDIYKRKSDMMSDRLGSLSASLAGMMDEQKRLMKMVQERDAKIARQAAVRRAKLQQLMESDNELMSHNGQLSADGSVASGGGCSVGTNGSLEHYIERQNKEMDAISAVIAAIRD